MTVALPAPARKLACAFPLALLAGCHSPSGPAPADSTAEPAAPSIAATAAKATAADSAPAPSADPTTAATAEAPAPAASGPCPSGMVLVRGGTFTRRKPNHKKTVTVATFCLDRAEVTVAAYRQCVKEKKCSPRCLEIGRCTAVPNDADWPDTMESIRASMFCNGSRADREDHPVNCVSFDEAKGYCATRGERLPTGDEWEWAAVADNPIPIFPWGRKMPSGKELCWGKPYRRPSTCLPGSFPKDTTRDGAVDMAGNLSEWVVAGTAERPIPQLRGSSWYAVDDGYIHDSQWGFESTSTRSEVFGFRCAKDAAQPSAP